MSRKKILFLNLISGLLFSFAWYPHGLPFLIFFAWIPLFFISDGLLSSTSKTPLLKGLICSWIGFLIWNAVTTYWIALCTVPGALGAIVANSFLQAFVFGFWHCCRKQIKQEWIHPILFAGLWISFEYLHLNWDLTWPWLNLGNVFAVCPHWVQWYSITGTFGGALWIIALNFLFFYLLRYQMKYRQRAWGYAAAFFLVLIIPALISACMQKSIEKSIDHSTPIEAVVVQQNTDPWEEEYALSNKEQAQRLIDVASPMIDSSTVLVVCPESSIPHGISTDVLKKHQYNSGTRLYGGFDLLDTFIHIHPKLNFILGLSTFTVSDHRITPTMLQFGPDYFLEQYNTACCYNRHGYNGHYNKSRLVPGVEKMPFPKVFGFLGDAFVKLGGANTSLGVDSCQSPFQMNIDGKPLLVGTAICYESIYGAVFGEFVRHGANLMTVITNDSWWEDTPGHVQHFQMARLRAIETRRYILRAANGGFSGVIDPLGNIEQQTKYNQRTAIKATVFAQTGETFYTKHGDYLAFLSIIVAALGFIIALFNWIKHIFHKA